MDVIALTNQLTNQPDKIIKILERLGCKYIVYNENKGYITSTRPEEEADNKLGQITYIDTLGVHQTTRSYQGNLFTLTMDTKGVNFPKSLELVAGWSGIKDIANVQIKYPFNGFFKMISKAQTAPESLLKHYSESDLPPADSISFKYIKDGVSALIQEKFGVRYSHEDDATIVPIYDYQGYLVGAKARSNNPNCDKDKRFWAFLEYSKTCVLFGYTNNYRHIVKKKKVIIAESEKAVMQAASFDCNLVLGIGGHSISSTQAKYIKSLNANEIILAFDEGICEDEIKYEAKKLVVNNAIISNKVGYIYDEENDLLKKGSKDSPFDNGKNVFKQLYKRKVRWL